MKTDIWMPLVCGDYLKQTLRLSTLEHGAYLLLQLEYWVTGEPLPDDDLRLRNITKTSGHFWKKIRPVLEKFFVIENGVWRHEALDGELLIAAKNKKMCHERAKQAAAKRWGKKNTKSNANRMLEGCPSPSPSSSFSKKKKKVGASFIKAHQKWHRGGRQGPEPKQDDFEDETVH